MVQQGTPRNTRPRPNNNNQNRPNGQVPTQNSFNPNITCFRCGNMNMKKNGKKKMNIEAYVTTRSRSVPYEISSPRGKRTRFSESRKEDQLRTQSIPPVTPSTPMDMDATAESLYEKKMTFLVVYLLDKQQLKLPVYRKGLIQKEETPTTAAKYEFHINQQPVYRKYVIKTANGTRVRSLGEIQDLPLKVRDLIIKTNVQIIESSDSVFILRK
ncbi:unnamed protein product [Rhizophagus irregularis]|nr:unnamed protein product [Rhizophagus irregularis]